MLDNVQRAYDCLVKETQRCMIDLCVHCEDCEHSEDCRLLEALEWLEPVLLLEA
jgi:hypothetical protein